MARKCDICGKGSMKAIVRVKLRGKYNPTAIKRQYPNLQQTTDPKTGERVKACTKCLKTLHKTK